MNLHKIAIKIASTAGEWYVDEEDRKVYDSIIQKDVTGINNKLKQIKNLPFEYSIQFNEDCCCDSQEEYKQLFDMYNWSDSWICIAMYTEQVDAHILPVAVNITYLNMLRYIDGESLSYIQDQIQITLWHELAHGLIRKFEDDDYDFAANRIKEICSLEHITEVVLGMPKHMNGDLGIRAQISIEFKEKLLKLGIKDVHLVDERLTTVVVDKAMIEGNMRRDKRKQKKDELAAVIILEDFLNRKK